MKKKEGRQLEHVPELIHHIQSLLPVKEAARTSILSKSWLHAWSTIPTLRFQIHMNVDRTLNRYIRDNIPIETFDLDIDAENQESASLGEYWTRLVATTQTCLKEISLSIRAKGASFMVPDEIFSGENLIKIRVSGCFRYHSGHSIRMSTHPVIKCVSLRELQLEEVHITEEVLHDILFSCSFLVKISLLRFKGLKTIKVKNRPCLQELTLSSDTGYPTILVVSQVPNLCLFSSHQSHQRLLFAAHSISLGSSVTQLSIGGVIIDDAFVKMIKSKFPLLESLSLAMSSSKLKIFDFTCASMKRLSLMGCRDTLLDVQVYAPKLLFFCFNGWTMANLLFPATTISTFKDIKLFLILRYPIDVSFFLKMREALTLSSKCYLRISTPTTIMPIDIDDLRERLRFPPAINMEYMTFESVEDECMWDRSTFFDAFFEICHPKEVFALQDMKFKNNNHFCRLMLREVLQKKNTTTTLPYWHQYLKHVQIRLHHHWETLTDSHTSFLDDSARKPVRFSLEWY